MDTLYGLWFVRGNLLRDFGYPDASVRQAKALLGSQIMKILDEEGLSTRQAEARSGVAHSEFSRIRQAKFGRFTIDRLMAILTALGQEVEVSVSVHPHAEDTSRKVKDDRVLPVR